MQISLATPLIAATLLLGACAEELSPAERAAQDERAIAMVEKANSALPRLREVVPEPIMLPDIESHAMLGAACNYAPGTSLATRVIARPVDAFIKLDGEILRLAADPGSRALPAGSRSLYDGREHTLQLLIEEGSASESDEEIAAATGSESEPVVGAGGLPEEAAPDETSAGPSNYQGTVYLRDRWGRVIYTGTGLVQCGE